MNRAFTVVEILVVVAIFAVLAALVVPFARQGLSRAESAKCLSHLRGIGLALNGWLADNNMTMPPLAAARRDRSEDVPVIDNTLAAFTDDPRIFACPSDRSLASRTGTSYFWNSALSGQPVAGLNLFSFVTDLSRIPILVDKEGWHRFSDQKVNHLFADGHVQSQLRLFTSP